MTWALQPTSLPTWIFPFTPGADFTVNNTDYFEFLMYRPLYWFGNGAEPTLNTAESLAYTPNYKGQDLTIRLKGTYRWSNGTLVSAQNIAFWMNMMKAEKAKFGDYTPGALPDNVTDIRAVSSTVLKMTIIGPYSPQWFTYNELSQVTPMPKAWDRTKSGPSDCTAVVADCPAVYNYLIAQSNDTSTYATSALWGVVDGPWRLTSYTLDGDATFQLNHDYSGELPAHHISTFEEVPFTTEQAEYNELLTHGVDVGYLPTVDAPVPAAGAAAGANPLSGYTLDPLYSWGTNYMPYDFNNPVDGPIFQQLYFRKAFQYLVDQEGVINGPLHGYGVAATSVVGNSPATDYLSSAAKLGDQYALNPAASANLLKENGWNVVPNGQTTCAQAGSGPGDCGPHISKGEPISITVLYVAGVSWVQSAMKELASNAAEVGITVDPVAESFSDVIDTATECAGLTHTSSKCGWDITNWGVGWSYSPDFLPTGEGLYESGAFDNFGAYSNNENDVLTGRTVQDTNPATFMKVFHQWENYLTGQIPVVMQPNSPYSLTETVNDLHTGVQNSTLTLTPEDWYFTK